jgi:hypothetical protein
MKRPCSGIHSSTYFQKPGTRRMGPQGLHPARKHNMNQQAILRLLFLTLLTVTPASLWAAVSLQEESAPSTYIGWIEEIRGPAYVKASADGKVVTLDPKHDRFRGLKEGELVRCGPGGLLKLQLGETSKKIKEARDWFTIRLVPSGNPEVLKAIRSYGRLGGRDRVIPSAIVSPSPGSTVRAESLVFRWIPTASIGMLSLSMHNATGREIWRQDGVNGSLGILVSPSAREALARYQDTPGQLSLRIGNSVANETRVYFSLLSSRDEKALDRELRIWKKKDDSLLHYVGRASTLVRYGLYAEAAAEYENGLTIDPDSRDLRSATIEAESLAGNSLRAKELSRFP